MFRKNLDGVASPISTHKFLLTLVPQQHMPVITVKTVEISAFARTFAGQSKRNFTQSSQFLQHARRLVRLC
jgi:hypothetical protein